MGRRARPPLFLLFLLVPLVFLEGSSACTAKTTLVEWNCTNGTEYSIDSVTPSGNCIGGTQATLTIDPLNATYWKVEYASSDTAEKNFTLRAVSHLNEIIGEFRSDSEASRRVSRMDLDTNGINLTNLHLQIESETGTVNAFPDGILGRVWSSVSGKIKVCFPKDATSTSSSATSTTSVSLTDATTIEQTSTTAIAERAATAESVVALPTYLATTGALAVVVIILLIVVIVLVIKLVGARRRASLNCFNLPTPSSSVVSSTHLELDRNSQKKQTWENFKSKERRRSAMLKPEPDTETGTGAGKQEPPSEPASQKPAPVLKNGRPKFKKTMTLGSFDS